MSMSKDIGILVAIPPELKAWVDSQAEDIGLNAAIWIRMLVFQARKRRGAAPKSAVVETDVAEIFAPTRFVEPVPQPHADDDWRGPVDDETEPPTDPAAVEALVAGRLAEAEAQGLTQSSDQSVMAPAPAGNVRALVRPAPKYSPAAGPAWIG